MMKGLKAWITFLVILLIINACSIGRIGIKKGDAKFSSQEQELEYYYAFTEATKQALFNNYKEAISLYNKCLKYNPASAAVYFQLSNIYMRAGELDLSKTFAKRAIKNDNQNIWYYLHLAGVYQIQRNIDSTINVYEKIVDLDNKNTEYLFNLALLYNEKHDYEKALKTIKKVEVRTGTSDRIIYLKHDIYSKLGKKKEAVKELRNGIKYFPDNINLYGLLAEYYSEIGEDDNADNLYQSLLKMDSASMNVRLSYADFMFNSGRKDEAFELYESTICDSSILVDEKIRIILALLNNSQILESSKTEMERLINILKKDYLNNLDIRSLAVEFNIKEGNFDKASNDLKFIIENRKNNINAWKQLVYIENFSNHYDSVIHYSDKAMQIFKEEVTFYIMKGLAFLQKEKYNDAIEILSKAEEYAMKEEDLIQIYSYLGELYKNTGNNEKSDECFEKTLKLDEDNIVIRNNYSYYLALRDTALKKAEKMSRYTIEKEPDNPTYLDTYAWILFKMEKRRQALKYIEKAVKYDEGRNSEILEHYGDILFSMSKYDKAIEVWKNVIRNNKEDNQIKDKIIKAERMIK